MLAALGFGFEGADKVIESAHGADPAAEEAAEEEGGDEDEEAPKEAAVKGVAGEGVGDGDERIELKEELDGVGQTGSVSLGLERAT